jgi:hypothetical protein
MMRGVIMAAVIIGTCMVIFVVICMALLIGQVQGYGVSQ